MTDGEPMEEESGAHDLVRLVGRQLKTLRLRAGLEREEFADRMGFSPHTIASIEQGRRRPPGPDFLDRADDLLDAGGVLSAAKHAVSRTRLPAFFRGVAGLEERAVEYHSYENQVVPGLLQTEEYTRALYRMRRPALDDDTVEGHVAARMTRRGFLDRTPPPTTSFVMEEVVLRRPLGGREVLHGQCRHLLALAARRNIEIQVLPTEIDDHAALGGPLVLLRPGNGSMVAYLEVQNASALRTDRNAVREIAQRYETIRAQALTPRETLRYIEKLVGET
ncbi:helix-turn-helix domain-containing protein [Streptomyces alkaliphilus]|uniref:helix-turn-helix domain-containing protein n=1 Tax=Streptomyces alkaliphilus TaxID=1472722 RepID=UPI001180F80E|nr:helix-turn-helix transcriptional regulator [Streptomyces alkaliphilus]MQS07244.1 helix-turn-helix domain-containing protein [Streptomyces alkaliphilus]